MATAETLDGKSRLGNMLAMLGVLLCLPAFSDSTEALWLFEEGAPGTEVATITNKVDPSKYSGTAFAVNADNAQNQGRVPVYSDDVPGKYIYSDSSRSQLLTSNARSVYFFSDDPDYATDTIDSGGGIQIPGLATRISELGSFTIEVFINEESVLKRWSNVYFVNSAQPWRLSFASNAEQICLQHDSSNMDPKRYSQHPIPVRNQWCHYAVVYDDETKKMSAYANGVLKGTIEITNSVITASKNVMIGCQTNKKMAMRGRVACMRLSRGALGVNEFMVASNEPPGDSLSDTLAFYPFKERTAGMQVDAVMNALDAGRYKGTAYAMGTGGTKPEYVADAPGAYIYSSAAHDKLLASNPQGIRFNGTDNHGVGSRIHLSSLLGTLYNCDEFTVEFFFKLENGSTWRTPLSLPFRGFPFKVSVPADRENRLEYQEEKNRKSYIYYTRTESFVDDTWHHIAVTWTNNVMWMFVDYNKVSAYVAQTNRFSETEATASVNLGCGTSSAGEAFRGLLACVRATPRRLEVDEFVRASSEGPVMRGMVFHWPFSGEDGENASVLSNEMESVSLLNGWADASGGASMPSFSADIPPSRAYLYENGRRIRENVSCLEFAPYEAQGLSSRAVRTTYFDPGGELHPESFTFEWFFKSEGTPAGTVLLAGRGGGGDAYDWRVGLAGDGSLAVAAMQTAASPGGSPVPYEAVVAGGNFADGRWHQAAVTYDASTSSFKVFADYAPVLATSFATSLCDTLPGSWMLGGGCGLGSFSGLMDEVRLTSSVLAPDAFLHLQAPPSTTILFR